MLGEVTVPAHRLVQMGVLTPCLWGTHALRRTMGFLEGARISARQASALGVDTTHHESVIRRSTGVRASDCLDERTVSLGAQHGAVFCLPDHSIVQFSSIHAVVTS